MLRVAAIPKVLEQICTDGVRGSALVTVDGALLGSSGDMLPGIDEQVFGAVSSGVWQDFSDASTESSGALDMLLMMVDDGQLAVARAGPSFLVCAYAGRDCATGILRAKLKAISDHLGDRLGQLGS